jgi:hypothetical protein
MNDKARICGKNQKTDRLSNILELENSQSTAKFYKLPSSTNCQVNTQLLFTFHVIFTGNKQREIVEQIEIYWMEEDKENFFCFRSFNNISSL